MSYYKYKPREVDRTVIDWAILTKNLSDGLIAEKERRESAKMELETKHAEQLQKVQEFDQGLDPTANDFAMKQAQNARQFLLQNHKMMTSGFKSVDDSKLVKQRVQDTWTNINSSLKTYNDNYKRLSEMDGKGNEAVLKALSNQLQLKNKQIYYDPNTGSGYYADVDKNGNIDMNSLLPVKAMNTIQHQEFETFDVNAQSAAVAQNVSQWKTFITSTQDLTDSRLNPNYQQWIDNQAKSALSNDEKKASILMDYLGIEYDVDGKPSQRTVTYQRVKEYKEDGSMVMEDVTVNIGDVEMTLNKQTGKLEPKLTPEQAKLAEDAYKNAIEIQIGREASKQYVAPKTPSAGVTAAKQTAQLIDQFVRDGSVASLEAALRNDPSLGITGTRLDASTNTLYVTKNGTEEPVDLNQNAADIGIALAGIVGIGPSYNNDRKIDASTVVNSKLFDSTIYRPLSQVVAGGSMSKTNSDNFEAGIAKNDVRGITSAIQQSMQEANLPTDLIVVKNGNIEINTSIKEGKDLADSLKASWISNIKNATPAKINDIIKQAAALKQNKLAP
jgi:hypothetical protein